MDLSSIECFCCLSERILLNPRFRLKEIYPVEQVESGIRIYLEKDYAGKGKKEDYLFGIIRNQKDFDTENFTDEKPPEPLAIDQIEEMHNAN